MSKLTLLGSQLDARGLRRFLEQVMSTNSARLDEGEAPVPICIWGTHGIGKTALVEEIARTNGWHFGYVAPAQFEEMGDLHGLPQIVGDTTTFARPDWVPTEPGPGVLLLDDFNRADDRILRGLMQLLQRSELMSWSLPDKWQIVATANPEGGDYSVTPLDDAMLTRLLHVSMRFDATEWARWATTNGVDERGISFVLTYPEIVTGGRTTPRSLTQFFAQIEPIADLQANWDLVHTLASSALDETAATAFMAFVGEGMTELVAPEEILDAEDFAEISQRLDELSTDESGSLRLDRLNTVCVRLFLHVTDDGYEAGSRHQANLVAFLKHDSLPNDLRMTLHRDLLSEGGPDVAEMMRDKELAELTLSGL